MTDARRGGRGRRHARPPAARTTSRPTSASSPGSSSPISSPGSAVAPRRCARDSPPPRPSSRPTTPGASPMPGPPSSPGGGTRCTTSSGPRWPWPRRTSRSMWPSTGRVRSPPSSPGPWTWRMTRRVRVRRGRRRCSGSPAPFDVVVSTNGGPPARPQPLPGGQGHGGGRADRARRGDHRDGGGLRATGSRATAPSPGPLARPARPRISSAPAGGAELDRWQAQVLGRVLQAGPGVALQRGLDRRDDRSTPARAGARPG